MTFIEALEIYRVRQRRKKIISGILFTLGVIVIQELIDRSGTVKGAEIAFLFLALILWFLIVVAYFFISASQDKLAVDAAKELYLQTVAEDLFEEFHCSYENGITEEEYDRMGFLSFDFEGVESEDLCYGICHGVAFRMADVVSKGNKGKQYFKGQWIEFVQSKTNCDLLIYPNSFDGSVRKKTSVFTAKGERRYPITTGDVEFDQQFTCLSHEKEGALGVLNPLMRRRIRHLNQEYDGQFLLAFVENNVYVLLNSKKDMLAISLTTSETEESIIQKFKEDLSVVPKLVDELGFNDVAEFGAMEAGTFEEETLFTC